MAGWLSKLFGGGPGEGRTVEELAHRLGMTPDELRAVPVRYRTFTIPKRSGGARTIHAPDDALKALQRTILRRLLARLKCHPHATGFERGHSIVTNALPHVGQPVVLRLDLRDYFTRTTEKRVREYFNRIGWNRDASRLFADLTTHKGGLPQGAPTSPRLSNLVNCRMDARLAGLARTMNAAYSRYADDLTFSYDERAADGASPPGSRQRTTSALIRNVKAIVGSYGYSLHNKRKLSVRRAHQQQRVTGFVVNRRAALPRRTRRWLRAVEHHLATGRPATLTPMQIEGWRALQRMVETQSGRT